METGLEMESQQHTLQSNPSYSESFCSWKEGSSLSFYSSSSRNISLVSWFSNNYTVLTLNVEMNLEMYLAFVETSLGILLFFGFGNQGLLVILIELILIQ